ncbi:hypothetical protein JTE90_027674 [Oedothorax gibbosus]|uniref:Uncharacterized protein n=1 Tax=Oedothorax gibbosus TaxID=931172 RepID=A0AAV6UP59_9ARAC|nr:hypothetical protein JTE90_027674 [Oedothorax gibbosus]
MEAYCSSAVKEPTSGSAVCSDYSMLGLMVGHTVTVFSEIAVELANHEKAEKDGNRNQDAHCEFAEQTQFHCLKYYR